MKDTYNRIVKTQFEFRKRYGLQGPYPARETALEYIGYVQDELQEARAELSPTFWKTKGVNFPAYEEEVADVLIMLIGLCAVSGISYDRLIDMVQAKLAHNAVRADRK